MWKKLALLVAILLVMLGLVIAVALKDTPARAAVGERRIVIADSLEIHYFSSGPVEGTPLLLLPSYARSVSDFNELVEVLNNAGYRTIGLQPRGIDGSQLASLDLNYHDYAMDLLQVLQAEAISDPLVLIGHAYGNRVARTFASDYPQLVKGLVLLAAGGETATPAAVSSAIIKSLFNIFPASTRQQSVQFAFFAEGNTPPPYWYQGWYPLAGLAQGNATASTPFEEWGSGGAAPMIILQPLEDLAAAGAAAALQVRFPERVSVYEIAHAGHALLPEQPGQVSERVLEGLMQLHTSAEAAP